MGDNGRRSRSSSPSRENRQHPTEIREQRDQSPNSSSISARNRNLIGMGINPREYERQPSIPDEQRQQTTERRNFGQNRERIRQDRQIQINRRRRQETITQEDIHELASIAINAQINNTPLIIYDRDIYNRFSGNGLTSGELTSAYEYLQNRNDIYQITRDSAMNTLISLSEIQENENTETQSQQDHQIFNAHPTDPFSQINHSLDRGYTQPVLPRDNVSQGPSDRNNSSSEQDERFTLADLPNLEAEAQMIRRNLTSLMNQIGEGDPSREEQDRMMIIRQRLINRIDQIAETHEEDVRNSLIPTESIMGTMVYEIEKKLGMEEAVGLDISEDE